MAGRNDRIGQLGKLLDDQYAHLARGIRRLGANKTKRQPVVEINPPILDAWGSLIESVVVLAATSAGIPGSAQACKVIKALCGVEEAEDVMLTCIQRDVQLVRTGPFRAAQEQLAIALREGPADAEYGHHLREAGDLLVMALGQSASVEESSVIRFNLGVVAAVRGDTAEAGYRLNESYHDCVSVIEELATRSADVKVFKSRWTSTASYSIPLGTYVIGARKLVKALKAQDAASALEGYVPFVNTVARAGNAIGQAPIHPGLSLRRASGEGYELEWTEPQL